MKKFFRVPPPAFIVPRAGPAPLLQRVGLTPGRWYNTSPHVAAAMETRKRYHYGKPGILFFNLGHVPVEKKDRGNFPFSLQFLQIVVENKGRPDIALTIMLYSSEAGPGAPGAVRNPGTGARFDITVPKGAHRLEKRDILAGVHAGDYECTGEKKSIWYRMIEKS